MARKELKYRVIDEGRDFGKVFVITEMPARAGHAWATRALFGAMNGGVVIPDGIQNAGLAGLATLLLSSLGKIPAYVGEPLLNELLDCVQIMPDSNKPAVTRAIIDDDIEEVATIFKLQKEVLSLHIEPFMRGAKSTSELAPKTGLAD